MQSPNLLVYIMLFGWIPIVLGLFAVMKPHRAVIAGYIFAWLFLPAYSFQLPGLPDYNKLTAAFLGVFLGVLIFDLNKLLTFKPRWFDIPIALYCLCPMISSLTNGLGLYDGGTGVVNAIFYWGGPYLLGRLYFNNIPAIRDFALAVAIGGLVYVPLCLYEIRMSPQLHTTIYGFFQHSFEQHMRGGGFRPIVFMSHALKLNAWMVACLSSVTIFWLVGKRRQLFGFPIVIFVIALALVVLLSRTYSGFLMAPLVIGVAYVSHKFRTTLPVTGLVLVCLLFLGSRIAGPWTGQQLVSVVRVLNDDRARSVEYRFGNENVLVLKAMQRPFFGWGGWGRSRDVSEVSDYGRETVTDSLWIIIFGQKGFVGLIAYLATATLPVLLFVRRFPGRVWSNPALAPPIVLAMMCLISLVSNIPNALVNPVFTLALGGLSSLMPAVARPGMRAVKAPASQDVRRPRRRASRLTRDGAESLPQSHETHHGST